MFDQQHLVCTNWFEVDCHAQLAFFTNDFGIKRDSSFEDEDIKGGVEDGEPEQNSFLGFSGQAGLGGRARTKMSATAMVLNLVALKYFLPSPDQLQFLWASLPPSDLLEGQE